METKYHPLAYCPIRKQLERRSQILLSRLVAVNDRLVELIGGDRTGFDEATAECHNLHTNIREARRDAQEHRLAHGC